MFWQGSGWGGWGSGGSWGSQGHLDQQAWLHLRNVHTTVEIDPSSYPGAIWNMGEYAIAIVTVHNTSGLPLRDIIATLEVYGAARIEPTVMDDQTVLDGDWYWETMEPNESQSFLVHLLAENSGTASFNVNVAAEVAPYNQANPGSASVSIGPPTS
jgi:hypothetical protein